MTSPSGYARTVNPKFYEMNGQGKVRRVSDECDYALSSPSFKFQLPVHFYILLGHKSVSRREPRGGEAEAYFGYDMFMLRVLFTCHEPT